jgi:hypothetical protein
MVLFRKFLQIPFKLHNSYFKYFSVWSTFNKYSGKNRHYSVRNTKLYTINLSLISAAWVQQNMENKRNRSDLYLKQMNIRNTKVMHISKGRI